MALQHVSERVAPSLMTAAGRTDTRGVSLFIVNLPIQNPPPAASNPRWHFMQ